MAIDTNSQEFRPLLRHFDKAPVMLFRRAAAALLAAAAFLLHSSIGAAPQSFSLGVLRADGVLIPIGAFDGRAWREIWTEPKSDFDVPVNLASVKQAWWGPLGPVDTWQAWTGAPLPQTLHVQQPDVIPANCLRQIGLRTEYRSPNGRPPIADHPYPKDGIAVAPPLAQVDSIDVVPSTAPEWKEFGPLVTEAFNRQEQQLAKRRDVPEHYPASQQQHEAITPVIEAVYAHGQDPRVYVVEAAREYWSGTGPKAQCDALAFGRLWLRRRGGSVSVFSTEVTVQRCDREDTSFMLPLAVIHAGDRRFWVAQFAGWDDERYDVLEVMSTGIRLLLKHLGGWC